MNTSLMSDTGVKTLDLDSPPELTDGLSPLPGLNIVDDCIFIDNSQIEDWEQCPRQWGFKHLWRRVPAGLSPALNFGGAMHAALEHRYRNAPDSSCSYLLQGECEDILTKWFAEKPNPSIDHRNLNYAIELFKGYITHYQDEPFSILRDSADKPLVEMAFCHHLFDIKIDKKTLRIFLTGKIDLPVYWNDSICVIDFKTTSRLGATFFQEKFVVKQTLGYAWALERSIGVKVPSVAIQALRTRPPAKTRSLVEDSDFERQKHLLPPYAVVEWKFEMELMIREILGQYYQGTLSPRRSWCFGKYGRCGFRDVCDDAPDQRINTLNSELYKPNEWSPLNPVTHEQDSNSSVPPLNRM